jgi:dsRNA-specific ribonuclease
MSENAKNQLLELLKDLGCCEDCAVFQSTLISFPNLHRSTVTVKFPDGRTVQGIGEAQRKSDADIAAAQAALDQVHNEHTDS